MWLFIIHAFLFSQQEKQAWWKLYEEVLCRSTEIINCEKKEMLPLTKRNKEINYITNTICATCAKRT